MAINGESERFWYGVNDELSMGGGMEKNRGSMKESREFGKVCGSMDGGGIGKPLVVWEVGSSIRKYRRSGEGVRKCVGVRNGQYPDTCIGDTYRGFLCIDIGIDLVFHYSIAYRYRLSMFLCIADTSISILFLSKINLTRC